MLFRSLGDVNDDTIIVSNRAAYETLRTWDKNYAAYGAALFMRHFDAAILRAAFLGAVAGDEVGFAVATRAQPALGHAVVGEVVHDRVGAALPKQYLEVAGRPLLYHSLAALARHPRIEQVFVVLAQGDDRFGRLEWRTLGARGDDRRAGHGRVAVDRAARPAPAPP